MSATRLSEIPACYGAKAEAEVLDEDPQDAGEKSNSYEGEAELSTRRDPDTRRQVSS